jgi:thioredoxin reductase (NADPH)
MRWQNGAMKPGTDGTNRPGTADGATQIVDCVVIGGGPAGLSAAVNMGRMRRSVVVVDDRDGRSLWGQTNRNYLGFPEGIPAAEIRLAGRRQAVQYGARLVHGHVRSAAAIAEPEPHYLLVLESCSGPGEEPGAYAGRPENVARDVEIGHALGEQDVAQPNEVRARTVIIASGVRDCFPEFDGWVECVGHSLFWCINCDGYETIGHTVAVVGPDEDAAETALQLLEFTRDVNLVAGSADGFEISEHRLAQIRAEGIGTYASEVEEYRNTAGHITGLVLADPQATRLDVDMVFQYHQPVARTEVASMLGVELDRIGQIMVDVSQQTNLPGVYAAGDVTHPHNHQISAAVHEGNEAACAANYSLYRPVQKAPAETESSAVGG